MDAVGFKIANNYREVVSIVEDGDIEVIDNLEDVSACATCQDCQFSIYTKANKTNELMCLQGNIPVHVNGICNLYVPVV
jgi:hypothetical protein